MEMRLSPQQISVLQRIAAVSGILNLNRQREGGRLWQKSIKFAIGTNETDPSESTPNQEGTRNSARPSLC